MWNKIKFWIAKRVSKAYIFWKEEGSTIRVLYFHDNTMYAEITGKTGYQIVLLADENYVRDIRTWINTMYDDGGPDAGNKKIVPLNRKFPLRKPPTSPT
jgi:hypothetical protein